MPAVLAVLESAHEALSFRTLETAAIDRGVPRGKARAAIKLGVTTGAITLAGTLAVANGGTGITSFGTGVAT